MGYIPLVLLLLCTSIQIVLCITFHIVTSSSSPCPGESSGEPCITLEQLADNSSQDANTTLMFEHGNHNLSSLLLISNGYNFTISGANATVLCTYQTGSIQIQQYNHTMITDITYIDCSGVDFGSHGMTLQVSNVSFINCGSMNYSSENVLLTNVYIYILASTFSVSSVQNFTVKDSRFEDINEGALQIYATSATNIMTSTFTSNGAGIKVENSGTVTISETTFSQHRARAVRTLAIISLYIRDCSFVDNNGGSSGGAVNVERAALITVENSNFSYNTANKGGAINAWAHLTIINCIFFANEGTRGGAIAHRGFSVILRGSTFTSNVAREDGGALHATNVVLVSIQTGFISNTARDKGGTIYITGNANMSELRVFQSYFYNSTATGGEGGVIFTDANKASISITESTFTFNSAASCAVVDVESFNHHINISDSVFTYNKATGADERGGVACIRNSSIFLLSSTFNHNTAAGDAGVFSIEESMVTIDGSTFQNNSAADDGGVMFTSSYPSTYNIQESLFSQNTAGDDGGVMFVRRAGSQVDISRTVFYYNSASDRGGVFAITATTLWVSETSICNSTAELGPVVSACNSEVVVPRELWNITDHSDDDSSSVCILYDGCINHYDFYSPANEHNEMTTQAEPQTTNTLRSDDNSTTLQIQTETPVTQTEDEVVATTLALTGFTNAEGMNITHYYFTDSLNMQKHQLYTNLSHNFPQSPWMQKIYKHNASIIAWQFLYTFCRR